MTRLEKLCSAAAFLAIVFVVLMIAGNLAQADSLVIYGGRSVSNSITDTKATSWAVEQVTDTKLGKWEFGYLNEGHLGWDKRDGIYALPRFTALLTPNLSTTFGIGPYFSATTVTQPDGVHYYDHYRWDVLGTATIDYSLTTNYYISARWGHTMFTHNKDSDLFLFGLGYNFQ